MDLQSVGRMLLIVGVIVAVVGGLLVALDKSGLFSASGSLLGGIQVQGQGFTCLVPVVGSILISVILTIVLNLIIRYLNRP